MLHTVGQYAGSYLIPDIPSLTVLLSQTVYDYGYTAINHDSLCLTVIIGKAKINRISMYRIQVPQTPICYNIQHIAAARLSMYRLCTVSVPRATSFMKHSFNIHSCIGFNSHRLFASTRNDCYALNSAVTLKVALQLPQVGLWMTASSRASWHPRKSLNPTTSGSARNLGITISYLLSFVTPIMVMFSSYRLAGISECLTLLGICLLFTIRCTY